MALRDALATFALATCLSVIANHAFAQDDDREHARVEFQRGVDAYAAESYQTALDAFQEAYRLAPHPSVRVNIANCYERLNRPLEALFHFEHFLSEAERPSSQQRREIESTVRRLRQLVGEIQLQVTPDGALVTIDGTEQRRAPVTEPVRVTAGRHTVDIALDGYETDHQSVEVAGGRSARVAVRLRRAEIVAATEPTSTTTTTATLVDPIGDANDEVITTTRTDTTTMHQADSERHDGGGLRIEAPTVIAGVVTIAAGIGAGITGGLAISANSDFDRSAAIYEDTSRSDAEREQARASGLSSANTASMFALVTDVLLATTIVGAGATIFFLVTTQDGGALDSDGSSSSASVAIVPAISDRVLGVQAIGSF